MGRHHAARDHTHALFRTQSHSFLANGATLFGDRRQCSHTAVEELAVIAQGASTAQAEPSAQLSSISCPGAVLMHNINSADIGRAVQSCSMLSRD